MNNTKKKRVLLVDDNPSILEILSMMLRSENLEIETANDGAAALDLITNAAIRNMRESVVEKF